MTANRAPVPGKSILAMAIVAVLAAPAASAQEQEPGRLDEIIVTAQKRAENLNDVPVSVGVVGADALDTSATVNTEALVNLVPSLTFRKGTSNVNSSWNMRGVGTNTFSSAVEPSVATVMDGVVLARAGMAFTDLMDVERVEVLRGPQGTLFGKNASAGVVNIVTKEPSDALEGYVDLSAADDEEYRLRAGVSGPIRESLSGRLSFSYGEYDGNIDNVFNGQTVNGYERYGVRGKLVLDAGDDTIVKLAVDYSKAKDDCCADVIGYADPNAASNIRVLLPSIAPAIASDESRAVDHEVITSTEDSNYGASVTIEKGLASGLQLTSITAARRWTNAEVRDGDFRSDPPIWVNGSVPGGDTRSFDDGNLSFRQFTQEVRLANDLGQRVEWVAGLFLYQTEQDNFFRRTSRQCTASTAPPLANGNVPCNATSTYVNASGFAEFTADFANWAAFGNLTFNVTDRIRLLAGARYTDDTLEYVFSRTSAASGSPGVAGPYSNRGKTSDDDVSYRVGAQFDVTDNIMAYATYNDGYKGPAFNLFFNMGANNAAPIEPEDVKASEVGVKATLFDGRMTANLAAFHSEFNGFHANSFITINNAVVSTLTNAGDVRTQGAELDVAWLPVDSLTLGLSAAYTDAEVTRANCAVGAAASCFARTGKQLPFSSYLKGSATAEWRLPIDALPFDIRVNAAYTYTGDTNYDLDRNPLAGQEAFSLVDAGVSFSDKNDRYRFSLLAKNLTDENYVSLKVINGAFVRNQVARDADRYFVAQLRVNFGN